MTDAKACCDYKDFKFTQSWLVIARFHSFILLLHESSKHYDYCEILKTWYLFVIVVRRQFREISQMFKAWALE